MQSVFVACMSSYDSCLKKIWNKNDCYSASVLKQDPKHIKGLKEHLFSIFIIFHRLTVV